MGLLSMPGLFGKHLAMDLGSANTLIHLKGEGIILNEPSLVAWNIWDKKVIAVGSEAQALLGRTPQHIKIIRPLKNGNIADFNMVKEMTSFFLKKIQKGRSLLKPLLLITTPSDINNVSKKALREAMAKVGGGRIKLISEPIASAIGAGLDIKANHACMLVNIGSGTTEIAVLFHGALTYTDLLRQAGDEITEGVKRHMIQELNAQLGDVTAEKCKASIGSAWDSPDLDPTMTLTAKDIDSGAPKELVVASKPLRQTLQEPLHELVRAINMALDSLPEKILVDIRTDGLHLCGGGALLHGLDTMLSHECQIPCYRCADPLLNTVRGCGIVLENSKQYRSFILP